MKRSVFSVLVALALCLSLIPGTALAAGDTPSTPITADYSWYTGQTSGDTYTIYDEGDLLGFANIVNGTTGDANIAQDAFKDKTVKLSDKITNLDLSSIENWTPIGKGIAHFEGTFDGNGKTISGLKIDVTENTGSDRGLFGRVQPDDSGNGGIVKNLAVSGSVSVNISRQVWVGGIVGNSTGTIQNCQFSGNVSGAGLSGSYFGGVAGYVSTIQNSYNTGNVSGSGDNSRVGGVAGYVRNSVSNCYNTGNVSGSSYVGSVAGYASNADNITNCFYLDGTVGTNGKGVGSMDKDENGKVQSKSAADFANPATFTNAGWGFTSNDPTWVMSPFGRPLLAWEKPDGSEEKPYQLATTYELGMFRDLVNAGADINGEESNGKYSEQHYQLVADLQLNEEAVPTLTAEGINLWRPIGKADSPFNGTFDGNGHTISGLAIDVTDSAAGQYHYGLFGYVGDDKNPTVKNLAVSGNVSATSTATDATFYVGGIVGYTEGTIQNCHFSGKVSGSVSRYGCFGGVAGYAYNSGSISNCYNTGSVSGSGDNIDVGGVAGQAVNVSNCFYLKGPGSALQGIGNNANAAGVEAASAERFASGEIAWKLQGKQGTQVWGQTLPGKNGDSPVLTADTTKRVYQVTIDTKETNTDADKTISCTNGIVTEPNPAPEKDNSAFRGWFVSTGENSYSQFDFNTPVSSDVTLLANWDCALGHPGTFTWETDSSNHWKNYGECEHTTEPAAHTYANGMCSECGAAEPTPPSSGGGSGGGGGGSSKPTTPSTPTVTVPVTSDTASVEVKADVSKDGTAKVEVSDKQIEQVAANGSGTVTVDVSGVKNVESVQVPSHVVETTNQAEETGLTVTMPTGSVALDETALDSVSTGEDVTVSVKRVPATDLNEAQQAAVGDMANIGIVVDVDISVGDTKQSTFNGGKLTISVPYTPKKNEDPSKMTVWYIKDDGTIQPMGGSYDAEKKCFVFETTHLSRYVIVSVEDMPTFTDVPNDAYYADAVTWAVLNGITTGMTETTFGPDLSCTRAQIVTFLWRAAGEPEVTGSNPFSDVNESDYFYQAVLWAVENKITTGTTETTFSPNDTCTRAQAAAFLYRNEQANGGGFTDAWAFQLPFTDVPAWCYEAVAWCYMNGVTQGTSETTFSPNLDCSRAQIVTMLYRENLL